MINKYLKRISSSEGGYASFIVTLISIIVVTLIVIGFASDARAEQKNALANNLATQAYYAAETGINDAYAIIVGEYNSAGTVASTNGQCATTTNTTPPYIYPVGSGTSNEIDGTNVEYTCLIVNPNPSSLTYQDVVPGDGLTIPISNYNSSYGINTLTISWQYYQSTVNNKPLIFTGCPTGVSPAAVLPQLNASSFNPADCGAPVLQLDMVSNTALLANPYTLADSFFLEPENNSGAATDPTQTPSQSPDQSGDQVYPAHCNATPYSNYIYACTQTINTSRLDNNSPGGYDTTYYLHLQTFYQPADIQIVGTDTNGDTINFGQAQILIDSTGYAGGQYKRLQERVCYGAYCDNGIPVGSLQTTECIFKYFTVYPGDSSTNPYTDCN